MLQTCIMHFIVYDTVINSIIYKRTFNNSIAERLITVCSFKRFYSKQLEYITKDILAGITVLNNIITLIARSCLYVARASSSFQCLDMHHATPIFMTEALRLATCV